jgi:nucleoside-diphosphate-sugar epimerase
LITGSSGQIGTNLALHLLRKGHSVFGVDKRQNTWTDDFPTLLQDLAGHYPAFTGGVGGVEYPEVDIVVHLAAHAKVHQLVAQPHRALENAVMTFNVLEFCRGVGVPIVFSSTREVYGDVRRFEGYGEATADFAFTESPYSASKIAGEALIYSYGRCYDLPYFVFRFSNVYGRYDNDLHRMVRVLPLFTHLMRRGERVTVFGRDKVLDFTYVDDCVDGIARGVEALGAGHAQPGVRRRQHAVPSCRVDRGATGDRTADRHRAVAHRRGDALHRRHPQGARSPRLGARDVTRRGDPEVGGVVLGTSSCASGGRRDGSERGRGRRLEARTSF